MRDGLALMDTHLGAVRAIGQVHAVTYQGKLCFGVCEDGLPKCRETGWDVYSRSFGDRRAGTTADPQRGSPTMTVGRPLRGKRLVRKTS